jgi:hypothetical protein
MPMAHVSGTSGAVATATPTNLHVCMQVGPNGGTATVSFTVTAINLHWFVSTERKSGTGMASCVPVPKVQVQVQIRVQVQVQVQVRVHYAKTISFDSFKRNRHAHH